MKIRLPGAGQGPGKRKETWGQPWAGSNELGTCLQLVLGTETQGKWLSRKKGVFGPLLPQEERRLRRNQDITINCLLLLMPQTGPMAPP